jgi:hypothetical protein
VKDSASHLGRQLNSHCIPVQRCERLFKISSSSVSPSQLYLTGSTSMPGPFGPQNSRMKQWLLLEISTRSWIYVDRRVNSFRTSEHARHALRQVHHFSTRHDDFALAVGQFDPFLFFHRSFHLMNCNRKAGAFASPGQKLRLSPPSPTSIITLALVARIPPARRK